MFSSLFDRLPASAFGMPDRVSRQWVIEHSDLAGRIMTKTPAWVEVPIPEGRAGQLFTHACYVVECDHEEACACADDNSVEWMFVEFFNISGDVSAPWAPPLPLKIIRRLSGADE